MQSPCSKRLFSFKLGTVEGKSFDFLFPTVLIEKEKAAGLGLRPYVYESINYRF